MASLLTQSTILRLAELQVGQPADADEAPFIIVLFWGFLPALLSYVLGSVRHGLRFTVKRLLWIVLLLGSYYAGWRLCLSLGSEDARMIFIYGGMAAGWIVAALLLLRPPGPPAQRHPSDFVLLALFFFSYFYLGPTRPILFLVLGGYLALMAFLLWRRTKMPYLTLALLLTVAVNFALFTLIVSFSEYEGLLLAFMIPAILLIAGWLETRTRPDRWRRLREASRNASVVDFLLLRHIPREGLPSSREPPSV